MKYFQNFIQKLKLIYSLLPIYSSGFKALSWMVLELFADKFSSLFYQRAITQERGLIWMRKKYMSAIFPWGIHIWNFKTLACTVQKLWYASKRIQYVKNPKVTKGHNSWCIFQNLFKS